MRARHYSIDTRRFISQDSLLGDINDPVTLNRYAYCSSNPVNYMDPSGRNFESVFNDFTRGYEVRYIDNFSSGIPGMVPGRDIILNTTAGNAGALVSDILSTVQGGGEIVSSGVIEVGGVGLDATGAGFPLGLNLNAAGAFVFAHGAGVVTVSCKNGGNDVNRLLASIEGGPNKAKPEINTPYKRPTTSVTKAQRKSVQGKPCATCGKNDGGKRIADHKKPLVEEYYETGTIDKVKMKDVESVQPQCPTCSAKQGARMSRYSKHQKGIRGLK